MCVRMSGCRSLLTLQFEGLAGESLEKGSDPTRALGFSSRALALGHTGRQGVEATGTQ